MDRHPQAATGAFGRGGADRHIGTHYDWLLAVLTFGRPLNLITEPALRPASVATSPNRIIRIVVAQFSDSPIAGALSRSWTRDATLSGIESVAYFRLLVRSFATR